MGPHSHSGAWRVVEGAERWEEQRNMLRLFPPLLCPQHLRRHLAHSGCSLTACQPSTSPGPGSVPQGKGASGEKAGGQARRGHSQPAELRVRVWSPRSPGSVQSNKENTSPRVRVERTILSEPSPLQLSYSKGGTRSLTCVQGARSNSHWVAPSRYSILAESRSVKARISCS